MCLALVSVITSIAGSIASYASASQQAAAQNEYYRQNAKAAQQAAVNQYAALQHKQEQERGVASRELFDNAVEGAKARATAATAAGEAGVGGLSEMTIINDLLAQQGRQDAAVDAQYQMTRDSIRADMVDVETQAQGRINSVQTATSPSPIPYLIQGIGSAVSAFGKAT